MTTLAVQTDFGALPTYTYPSGYDPTKLGLGQLMVQSSGNEEENWIGPMPVSVARPVETSGAIPGIYPYIVQWSSTYDWVFLADNAAAAATRRFQLFTFNKTLTTNQWSWAGFITCTVPFNGTQGTYVIRGLAVSYEKYTTGTVSINNGSASLTGSGTTWSADRMFIGSRIGFGSTDPTQITNWYEISAIGSDTGITLTQAFAQSNISGSAYVIEDLRLLWCATNGTTVSNAGVFMTAGLRFENFTPSGTAVPAATTVDKIRANYWLSDGNATSNTTNQSYGGIDIGSRTTWTNQRLYAGDYASGTSRFQVTNFRNAMTLTAGRDSAASTFQFNTGQQGVTGTVSQTSNLVLCTPAHGPRNGVQSLFWVTTSRIYSAALTGVTTGATNFQSGAAIETPPGGTTTYPVLGTLSNLAYGSSVDRFYIFTTGVRHYCTQYREDAGQWDRVILINSGQTNVASVDTTAAIWPTSMATTVSGDSRGGITYLTTTGTTNVTNFLYAIPFGADWDFAEANNRRIVLPEMDTSNFNRYIAGFMSTVALIGGSNLGMEPGAVRMYYRTEGISDDSGEWTLLDYTGDMSAAGASSSIQAMLEFRTQTLIGLPARVTRVGFIGSGAASDGHYQFSVNHTSLASKQFAFRHAVAFGTTVPTLVIQIYDAVTGNLLVNDDSVTQTGTWEKTTNNGSAWVAYNTTDKTNETTYIRYTPASIADNVNALPILGLA